MIYLIILVLLFAAGMLFKESYKKQPPEARNKWLITRILWLFAIILIIAAMTGRFHPVGALSSPLIPILWQAYNRFLPAKARSAAKEQAPPTSAMSRAQAMQILGLEEGYTEQEVRAAHKKLMAKNHPDKGGSEFLAAQINQAKDVLLS